MSLLMSITEMNTIFLHHKDLEVVNISQLLSKNEAVNSSNALTSWYWSDSKLDKLSRRQLNLTEFLEDRKREQVTVQPSAYGGPKRNKFYDPNYGYEIYWADGNWVLEWFHKFQRKNESSCDEKCVAMHYKYGKVCGRNKRFESRTFDDMCQMRHFDCADDDGWVPVYRGECRPDLKVITTLPSSTVTPLPFPSMADIYVAEFEARHPHLSNY
ncbi:hypothetical protein evm_000189 [Chilo suppressalis]|nr:hypothetical protein evm_000189 [Chilo suppressalis]